MIAPTSPDWAGLKAWLQEQIATEHQALENPHLAPDMTAVARGRIAGWRAIIEEVEPEHTEGDASPDYTR